MKVRLGDLPVGACYRHGGRLRKKVADGRYAAVGAQGRVRTRAQAGDPQVEPVGCTIRLVGVGLRGHPSAVVEIGRRDPPARR